MKKLRKLLKIRKDKRVNNSLFSFGRFAGVFVIVGFIVTCSFFLFFGATSLEILIPQGTVKFRALVNLGNILFLCLVASIVDGIMKRINFQIPIQRILDATHKITRGDFSARIIPPKTFFGKTEFNAIIEDFNKMAEELSSIETLKTDFISNVSHELKTPISVIQNYSVILQDPKLTDEERIEYAKNLNNASKNLSELVTSILKLNKLENQQMFLKSKKFNLSEQLRQSLLLYEQDWEKKNIEIITNLDDSIEINADEELLWLVWSNLISNAIKFTENGGTITVNLRENGVYAITEITDTGCGMDEKTKLHAFEKFYQGDNSHATKGNGLGLALVKRVTDIANGEVFLDSEEGKGSTFTVILPLK